MAVGDPESDRHHKKNAPEPPPVEFPPYEFRPFPAWVYHWKEEARIVQTEEELANFLSRGWADHPHKVEAARQAYELAKSDNAAQRAADDRRMSPAAKAEHAAADDAADDHVLDLPVPKANKKKPGPKPKAAGPQE